MKIFYDGSSAQFYNRQTMSILRVSDAFEPNDITFTGWGKSWAEPDLIWVTQDKLTDELLESGKPIIIEDYNSSPDIYENVRKIMDENTQVRAIVKSMALRRRTEYNLEQTNYSAHCHRLIHSDKDLDPEDFGTGLSGRYLKHHQRENVRVMWNWIAWPLFRPARGPAISYSAFQFDKTEFENNRQYDVNFIGNTSFDLGTVPHAGNKYSHSCIVLNKHRKNAIKQLERLKCPKLIQYRKRMPRLDYLKKMQESKIVVSPWGWEPMTYRDLEAVLCGCVLVKPYSHFVETWPEPYYVPCKEDFSNLSEVTREILENWDDYTERRVRAYNELKEIDDQALAGRFSTIAKDCLFKDVI